MKKRLLVSTLVAFTVAAGLAASAVSNVFRITAEGNVHDDNCEIHHYAAVAPTFESAGAKEYWICCQHNSDGPVFTQPTGGTITNATHDASFLSSLSSSDLRYIAPYKKVISFEDGVMPSVLTLNRGTGSIVSDVSSHGSKCLKVEGAVRVAFDTTYLTKLFELYAEDDDAILFDMKGTDVRSDLYYSSLTKQYGVYRYDQITNIGNSAVQTGWKTFAFTKDFLSDVSNGEVIRTDSSTGSVYIDNIRIGKPYSKAKYMSFEDDSVYNNQVIPLSGSWTESFKVTNESSVDMTVSISDAYASEGHNSLHIQTTAATKVNTFMNADMYNATEVGWLFDWYTPTGAAITNVQNRYKAEGNNVYYSPQNYTTAGKWITYFVPKSAVYNNDYMLFRCSNSIVNDFYIDNLRVADPEIDFEHGEITTFGGRKGYTAHYDGNYLATDAAMGSKNGCDFWFYSSFNVSLSDEKSTNGAYSIKAECTAKYNGLYISDRLYNALPTEGLVMDMYVNKAVNFNSLVSGQSGVHDWSANQWVTVTVPKAYIGKNSNTNEWCVFTYGDTITSYIDNVRAAGSTVSSNSSIVDAPSYDWYN